MQEKNQDFPLHDYYQDIYEKYDLVNRIFTFGRDAKWRREAVTQCLENSPSKVLDICTGTGDLILEIARAGGENLDLYAYDFTREMLQIAMKKAEKMGADVQFIEGDVASMPFESNTFDSAGISFGLRNLVYENSNADQHLAEIYRTLKHGGRFVILESSKPGNAIWRFFNGVYLRLILPYLGGLISGNLKAYRYLAKSSKNYYTREEMGKILENSNFKVINSKSLFLGSVMLMVAEKEGN